MKGRPNFDPDTQVCTRCGERQSLDSFYFVSKKLGTRRGQCKECMREVKAAQRDPNWKPQCASCGAERPRVGPGRRLCEPCFRDKYDGDHQRDNRSHRLKLAPCRSCGAFRTREDHEPGTSLCAPCRSVPQHRRKKLRQYYDMTPAEAQALLEFQGMGCAICRAVPRSRHLSIDHDHEDPSLIRGALCAACNTALGLFKDNPETFRRAIEYLLDPPAQRVIPGRVARPEANDRPDSWTKNPYAVGSQRGANRGRER